MTDQPNIILVMVDQLTAFALSSYGNTVTKPPNLDDFSQRAVVFENAYCNYPLCAPARFAMMTGRLPSNIAAYDNASELPASIPTFAHYLRDAGYYTCLSGKMHFVGPDQHHGFEDRLTTEIYPADFSWTPPVTYENWSDPELNQEDGPAPGVSSVETITESGPRARSMQMDYDGEVIHRSCQHLYDYARQSDNRPILMTVSFTQPHDPYVSSQPFWDLYCDEDIDQPKVPPIPIDQMDPHSRSLYFHYSLNKFPISDHVYRRARRGYYAMISDIDAKFGQLMQTLNECHMNKNTVVLFTSDHGDMIGERGLWFKKTLFDPAIRIPMMIHWPGKFESHRIHDPVSLVDILPSLLDIGGISSGRLTTPIDGKSLLKTDRSQPVCAEHLDGGTRAPRVMMRIREQKIVYSQAYPAQLYDLSSDPNEIRNLADHPDWQTTYAKMVSEVESKWDLTALRNDIINNQRTRQLLHRSLNQGRKQDWEHYPNPHRYHTRWVREGDFFPEAEQRGYLDYPFE